MVQTRCLVEAQIGVALRLEFWDDDLAFAPGSYGVDDIRPCKVISRQLLAKGFDLDEMLSLRHVGHDDHPTAEFVQVSFPPPGPSQNLQGSCVYRNPRAQLLDECFRHLLAPTYSRRAFNVPKSPCAILQHQPKAQRGSSLAIRVGVQHQHKAPARLLAGASGWCAAQSSTKRQRGSSLALGLVCSTIKRKAQRGSSLALGLVCSTIKHEAPARLLARARVGVQHNQAKHSEAPRWLRVGVQHSHLR